MALVKLIDESAAEGLLKEVYDDIVPTREPEKGLNRWAAHQRELLAAWCER